MANKREQTWVADARSPSRIEEMIPDDLLGRRVSIRVYDRITLEGVLDGSVVRLFRMISSGKQNPRALHKRTLILVKLDMPLEKVDEWWTLDVPVKYVEVIVETAKDLVELQSNGETRHIACSVYAMKTGEEMEASESDIFEQIVEIAKEADLKLI